MVRQMSDLETNIVSVERVKEYSELEPEVGLFLCFLFIYLELFRCWDAELKNMNYSWGIVQRLASDRQG